MSLLRLLAQDNFITVNKTIAKKCGIDEAILFGAFCMYQNQIDGEFYRTYQEIEKDTCLSEYRTRTAIKTLNSIGVLTITKRGIPAQNYYRIIEEKLCEILSTSPVKITEHKKENNNKELINNIIAYMNEVLGTRYTNKNSLTQRMINARIENGFKFEDFKSVIDYKYKEWSNTKMKVYLRPETLFGTKFEGYLNSIPFEKEDKGIKYVEENF